jgi:Fanconi-associated nuclease 1
VLALLAAAGRPALHAENWFWTSLFALVFRDLYFAPVPGMLPTSRRSGPLDLGTPGFHRRRAEAVEARLREVGADGPARWTLGWTGERLAGLGDADAVRAVAAHVPGPMAAAVLGRLAREGWDAARGLPDLLVLPGSPARLAGAVPATLGEAAFLAEVKGPGDTVRDEQRLWMARLHEAAVPVELWILRA